MSQIQVGTKLYDPEENLLLTVEAIDGGFVDLTEDPDGFMTIESAERLRTVVQPGDRFRWFPHRETYVVLDIDLPELDEEPRVKYRYDCDTEPHPVFVAPLSRFKEAHLVEDQSPFRTGDIVRFKNDTHYRVTDFDGELLTVVPADGSEGSLMFFPDLFEEAPLPEPEAASLWEHLSAGVRVLVDKVEENTVWVTDRQGTRTGVTLKQFHAWYRHLA